MLGVLALLPTAAQSTLHCRSHPAAPGPSALAGQQRDTPGCHSFPVKMLTLNLTLKTSDEFSGGSSAAHLVSERVRVARPREASEAPPAWRLMLATETCPQVPARGAHRLQIVPYREWDKMQSIGEAR